MIRVLPTPNVAHGLAISAVPVSLPERGSLVCQWSRGADGRLICTWRHAAPDCYLPSPVLTCPHSRSGRAGADRASTPVSPHLISVLPMNPRPRSSRRLACPAFRIPLSG
jgi:hypothetical protein